MASKPKLSIIILSFNTKKLLEDCLKSLQELKDEISFEVIVADNGSIDGSLEMVKEKFSWVVPLNNKANLGFAKGNNAAREFCRGKYVLFLNSDTIVYKGVLKESVKFLEERPDIGAMTCKLVLADGKIDKDIRRRFPTPWVSFNRLVLGNGRLYWYEDISEKKTHEVDAIQGAYFLSPKKILDEVGWFSEDYFLDGEDIDLCWKIRAAGYKIYYYPKVKILHLKGASKGKSETKGKVPLASRLKFRMASVNSMEIFYKKWLWKRYPLPLNLIVLFALKCLKAMRFIKTVFS
jgi:hypothetical protein